MIQKFWYVKYLLSLKSVGDLANVDQPPDETVENTFFQVFK